MLRERAKAKINSELWVLGKRDDGYHDLLTSVCFAEDVADALVFAPSKNLSLDVTGEFAAMAGGDGNNLVLRAGRALNAAAGTTHGAAITLEKNIPVGAGLGGGSADAAAALRFLNRWWGLDLPMAQLETIGLTLGADVPMCLHSTSLEARGVGEKLTLPQGRGVPFTLWYVLVFPQVKLETARVFAAYQRDPHCPEPLGHVRPLLNDLEYTACRLCPAVGEVLAALRSLAVDDEERHQPRMTGSGTACFMMLPSEHEAAEVARKLQRSYPQWWVKPTRVS